MLSARISPGGEFFGCPLEDSAEGEISFSEFPAVYAGRELWGSASGFAGRALADAAATSNEAFLHELLDTDDGARRLGELGVGCNPGITRYMKNTLFDEKMDGTIHLALGQQLHRSRWREPSRPIHWDLVKDLRPAGCWIELDGVVVQHDGVWLG